MENLLFGAVINDFMTEGGWFGDYLRNFLIFGWILIILNVL